MITRFKVALKLNRLSVGQLITFATSIVDSITGNSFFATPAIPLADISTAITELQDAATAAETGGVLETQIMNIKRIALSNLLTAEGAYVEQIANDPANAIPLEQPIEIIESAGMPVKQVAIHQKQIFAVKAGLLVGTVVVTGEAVRRGFHEWQYTTTPDDDSSWVIAPSTTRAKVTLTGLVSGSRVYVRHRAVLISGAQNWDGPVAVIVP